MDRRKVRRWSFGAVLLLGTLIAGFLTLGGCGGGYDTTTTGATTNYAPAVLTKTTNALVNAATLKGWVDAGLVNKGGNTERVVILEVNGTTTNYDLQHIPGAISVNLNADLTKTRVEGPMLTGSMVADGTMMDTLIQRCGIDKNTTIVFTTSEAEIGSTWNLTRGYVTFRYWGFPKERLKVLNGGNKSWKTAGYALTAVVPAITKSTYGVTPDGTSRVRADLRASLSDMIAAVQAGTTVNKFIDGRAVSTFSPYKDKVIAGPTTDLIDSTKYVVFDGKIKGSDLVAYTSLVDSNKEFLLADTIKGLLNIGSKANVYTLCRAGNIASVLFFAIDGYAYYNETESGALKAIWYDGSWGQWGLMAALNINGPSTGNNAGGKLVVNSVWDTTALTDSIVFSIDAGTVNSIDVYKNIISYASRLMSSEPPITANQIEESDIAYRSAATSTSSSGTKSGGGGC